MAIVKVKSRGKEYYQVREGSKLIKHLGSQEKILKVFQYWETANAKKGDTEPEKY